MGFPSKVRHSIDADAKVILKALNSVAVTADESNTPVSLDTLKTAYWHNSQIPQQSFSAVVNVKAIDSTTGDEVYDLYVEADTDVAFPSAVEVAHLKVSKVGVYVIDLDGPTISLKEPGATHLRLRLDVGGTTPILQYESWLAPIINQG